MSEPADFEAFWEQFLRSHHDPLLRWCHVAALGCGVAALGAARRRRPLLALTLGGAAAALAVGSHHALAGKGPENLGRPLWGARAFLRLCLRTVSGRIEDEVRAQASG